MKLKSIYLVPRTDIEKNYDEVRQLISYHWRPNKHNVAVLPGWGVLII